MKFGNREHAMHPLQVLNVTNYGLFVHIEDRHQIGTKMGDVKSATLTVQTLIIETGRAAAQRNVT